MERKKRSFGSLFLGFILGFVSFILILVLIVSVGINILFYSDESAPKIDVSDYHYTFFVNNCDELEHIDDGSFLKINHSTEFKEGTYVLCSVGSGYKTVLCLSSITENENGSMAYNVRGDKADSTINYSLPESKILGTVMNKNDLAGDVISFAKELKGVIALMAIPSFLLIIISIASIRRKKARYDDEVLESEIYLDELRKMKRNEEKRAEETRKKLAQAEQEEFAPAVSVASDSDVPFEEYTRQFTDETPETPEKEQTPAAAQEVNKYEYINFEDEAARKAIEIKKALLRQTDESLREEAEAEESKPAESAPVQSETRKPETSIYNEQLNPEAPVFQEMPVPTVPEPSVQSTPVHAEINHTEPVKPAEQPKPAEAPKPAAPVKKKPKPPVKKIEAESIDDLIRILEDEKKKLG